MLILARNARPLGFTLGALIHALEMDILEAVKADAEERYQQRQSAAGQ